jgi:hypothetical protein
MDGVRGKWRYDSELQKLVPVVEEVRPYVHAVIQDTIDATWHPATGQKFESKSAFRRVTKEKGYIEVDDNRTWNSIGTNKVPEIVGGLREDIEEVKAWYTAAINGNRDYINANVPPELRDCEEVDINDVMKGVR